MVKVRSVLVTVVSVELSVQSTTSVPPLVVPIAYSYFSIPLNASSKSLHVAIRVAVELSQSISVSVPSTTLPATGVAVSTVTPSDVMVVDSFSALSVAFTLI